MSKKLTLEETNVAVKSLFEEVFGHPMMLKDYVDKMEKKVYCTDCYNYFVDSGCWIRERKTDHLGKNRKVNVRYYEKVKNKDNKCSAYNEATRWQKFRMFLRANCPSTQTM